MKTQLSQSTGISRRLELVERGLVEPSTENMNPASIIAAKRDGGQLTPEEISFFVRGFHEGRIPDYQMSALAMAIYLKGMSAGETAALTESMLASGTTLTWPEAPAADQMGVSQETARPAPRKRNDGAGRLTKSFATGNTAAAFSTSPPRDTAELDCRFDGDPSEVSSRFVPIGPVVDKHSTGGLGDKTSLVLAPLLACCGLRVPMISGRGLGATGGTLDKLESIPGFRTDLSLHEIQDITNRVGCVITGASAELAPADRKLYALRDVTGTVASIPLITASIMSKKLAEGLNALVLDVKFGSGAFMKTMTQARRLAASLVETGERMGVRTSALLTNMDQPLGRMVGNTLEVDEAIDCLYGRGPADLWDVTRELGADLLLQTGLATERKIAHLMLNGHISSGRALARFRAMVVAQGGDPDAPRRRSESTFDVVAPRNGHVAMMNAEAFGLAVIELGGGRRVMTDKIDHSVGLEMLVRIGQQVQLGEPLVRVHAPLKSQEGIKPLIRNAIHIRPQPANQPALVVERV